MNLFNRIVRVKSYILIEQSDPYELLSMNKILNKDFHDE